MTTPDNKADTPPPPSPPLWKDLVMISRPGWWLVSLWLYLAPISSQQHYASIPSKLNFTMGLLYVCLPLNLLTYGLNDYADVNVDVNNERKGNFVFGSKGLSKERLWLAVKIAFCGTLLPLPLFFSLQQLNQIMACLVWYLLGILVNVSYNFSVLGKLSGQGPWEFPLVYIGFGLVTAFSYWVNVAFQQDTLFVWRNVILGNNVNDTFHYYMFGCNKYYWIHLAFLICTTQAWTEYMDYDVDAQHKRQTTLVRMGGGSKRNARLVVMCVLWIQVAWTYSVYRRNHEWNMVLAFAITSAVMFGVTEQMQRQGKNNHNETSLSSSPWIVAIGQNVGGLLLLHNVWSKGLFVR